MRLWSFCGPFRPLLRSLCGPNPHEHPRIPANTASAAPSIFAAFRWYSRQFADLRNIGAPRFELGTSPTRTVRATRLRHAPTHGQYPTRAPATTPRYGRPMPAAIREILAEADRLLEPARFEDYCVNGLQVPGPERALTIATGVSAHAELFELAAGEHAELLLVHHGLFGGSGFAAIDPSLKRRLQILFDAEIALAAYHLPL